MRKGLTGIEWLLLTALVIAVAIGWVSMRAMKHDTDKKVTSEMASAPPTSPSSEIVAQAAAIDPATVKWDGKSPWITKGETVFTRTGYHKILKVRLVAAEDVPAPRTQVVSTRVLSGSLDSHCIPQTMREITVNFPGSINPDTEVVVKFMRTGLDGREVEDNLLIPAQTMFKGWLLRLSEPEIYIGP